MRDGEVGIEVAPILEATSEEQALSERVDALLPRTCRLARALTGAEQAALKLWVDEDPQAEVEAHPAWQGFGDQAGKHPPMRGWLATAVCGEVAAATGSCSSRTSRARPSSAIRTRTASESSPLVGETLDALRTARSS